MQVVLLERVEKLGQIGDVVKVKDGFARNFLLAKGKALRATKENKARFESMRKDLEAKNIENRGERFFVSAQRRLDATKIARALSRPVDREAGHATPDEHIVLDVGEVLFRHVHAGHEYDARRFLHILRKVKNSGNHAAFEWNLDAL